VFVPGAGLDYLKIRDQVSQLTTSVLFDRGGTGWSDALELPRTATAVTDELRELLRAPGVQVVVARQLGTVEVADGQLRSPADFPGSTWIGRY
jgi:hypothetical protein